MRNEHILRYHISGSPYMLSLKGFIDSHESEIVSECQSYLSRYEQGDIPQYATDLDLLLELLDSTP